MERIYGIYAKTAAGVMIGIGFTPDLIAIIRQFIDSYPRFRGKGLIISQFVKLTLLEGCYDTSALKWENFYAFKSTKELKKYLGE